MGKRLCCCEIHRRQRRLHSRSSFGYCVVHVYTSTIPIILLTTLFAGLLFYGIVDFPHKISCYILIYSSKMF